MSDLDDLYQSLILDHNRRPRNWGALEGADREERARNPLCGDEVTLWLRLDGETIADVRFEGVGCAISKASASVMTTAVKGRSVAEAEALFTRFHELVTGRAAEGTAEALPASLRAFGGVSRFPVRVKCASMAWHALHAALRPPEGFVPVARVEQLAPDTLLGVTTPDGTPVCLVNRDGELLAMHDVCSHQAFPLSAGELLADGTVECSWHGARFDPCSGQACRGPACEAVRTYELLVRDGVIHVRTEGEGRKA